MMGIPHSRALQAALLYVLHARIQFVQRLASSVRQTG